MENNDNSLAETLKKLFLLDTSYHGFNNRSYKYFQNYFLSLLYSKRELAFGLIDYINYQELPEEFRNKVVLLESILYSLNEETQGKALEKVTSYVP